MPRWTHTVRLGVQTFKPRHSGLTPTQYPWDSVWIVGLSRYLFQSDSHRSPSLPTPMLSFFSETAAGTSPALHSHGSTPYARHPGARNPSRNRCHCYLHRTIPTSPSHGARRECRDHGLFFFDRCAALNVYSEVASFDAFGPSGRITHLSTDAHGRILTLG
ncbi:hypothetical protein A4X13_0g4087 [Tilletia indica]|uniref:Uncharacterized protein n=1 Tax=Tilletia indica TaxID=43049 RepID=A0A8T8SY59_9BASI|nr:hypothetical protein A4X13_0g4087 [Tilletia indica]